MAAKTFVLPSGNKVRTATNSRFVLIGDGEAGAWIEKRSSTREVLVKHRQREWNKGRLGFPTQTFIGDTVTGEVSKP